MVKAIFFDLAGVLMEEGFISGVSEYENRHSIKKGSLFCAIHDFSYWKDFTMGKISEGEYFRLVQNNFNEEIDFTELKNIMLQKFIPNPELIKYIKTLKNKYIIGIITNNPKEWFDNLLEKFSWKNLFDVKAVSGYLHIRKPDKEIFLYALKNAGVSGDEAVYVDDRIDRVEGARQVGMKIIIFKDVDSLKKNFKKDIKN